MLIPSLRRFGSLGGNFPKPNPFPIFDSQLKALRSETLHLVESRFPILSQVARYYLQQPSKHVRPLLILLFSHATNGLGKNWQLKLWESTHPGAGGREDELDIPFSPPHILFDYGPQHKERFGNTFSVLGETSKFPEVLSLHNRESPPIFPSSTHALCTPATILPTQTRLSRIIEIVHTASLLHDDLIDKSTIRRGVPSAPFIFSRELCMYGGHYLAALSSRLTVQLRNPEVTRMMSKILTNLIEGEMLQAEGSFEADANIVVKLNGMKRCEQYNRIWNAYLQKSYLKTGALIARSLRATVMLGGCAQGEIWREIAYAFGRNFGIAFQLVDDVLDFKSSNNILGKPCNADIRLGLVTAPVLYGFEEFPEMGELMKRGFQCPGDVEKALDIVHRSSGIRRSTELAQEYADQAKKILRELPPSDARDHLEALTDDVLSRAR